MSGSLARRPKILFLASWYPSKEHPISGIFIKRHAHAVSRFCDVAVLYINIRAAENNIDISKDGDLIEIKVSRRAKEHCSPLMKKIYWIFLFYIDYLICGYNGYKIVKRVFGRPDLVNVNVITPAGHIGLALKIFKGLSYVITEHSSIYREEDGGFRRRSLIGRCMITAVVRNAKAIMTVSANLRDAMIKCGLIGRYYVVPNAVDLECAGDGNQRGMKKRIVHISLLVDKYKNITGILKAIKILSNRRDDFELRIVGDGPDREMIEAKAEEYGLLNEFVFFYGMLGPDDARDILASSDFSVVNSNFETFCVAAAESLACGKPVVATRSGGPEEYMNEMCGVLIKPGDDQALVEALDYMLDSYSNYDSSRIRAYAKSKFSSRVIGAMIYEVFKEMLK
jgi:glycosyltransferase involved in cell wall biosynthesis